LLAQRQEIKRLEKEREEARRRIKEDEERRREEAKVRDLREFEMVSMGLEGGRKRKAAEERVDEQEKGKLVEVDGDGKRRKVFELDEKMAKVARDEQERLKKEIEKEKVWTYHSPLSRLEGFQLLLRGMFQVANMCVFAALE
jgi:nitric oxide synthase-interacting protein